MSPMETAVVRAVPWLVGGLVASPLLLLVPGSWDVFPVFVVHLAAVVSLGIGLALAIGPVADAEWFHGSRLGVFGRMMASAVAVVVIVTGVVGLVTLASSAALRYQPSLQFLQLLSALDIAWAGAAIVVGAGRGWGTRMAALGGGVLGVFCVWSIWNYLRIVGFTPDGGWRVEGAELMRLVLPFDMAAAVVAVAVLVVGTRRRIRATAAAAR